MKLVDNIRLVRRLAVIMKANYSGGQIYTLFTSAGGRIEWLPQASSENEGQYTKEQSIYVWIESIKNNTSPNDSDTIMQTLIHLIVDDGVSDEDREFLLVQSKIKAQRPVNDAKNNIDLPESVEKLLEIIFKNIPKAVQPLKNRRANSPTFAFDNEYDVQTLLHTLMSIWIKDIRPEEYTPSYVGSSTRIDFVLPQY